MAKPAVDIEVDIARLMAELATLAAISEAEPPVVTRVVFSEADLRARAFVMELCREAGLEIREDAVGNMYLRWEGTDPGLGAVGTGSHTDAIPYAGMYDGTVGVLGTSAANHLAGKADVILAFGTRLQDFITGSWTAFAPDAASLR